MGCDYFIDKLLKIELNDGNYFTIVVKSENAYYWGYDFDEDDQNYEKLVNDYKNSCLTVNFKPIAIYENNKFLSEKLETKYKKLIDYELHGTIFRKYKWEDVLQITKIEERYERD